MLALIAGTGGLPAAILKGREAYVCAMVGFVPDVPVDITFRIEHLGSILAHLKGQGVTEVCFAGAVKRPRIDPSAIDAATMPLVPIIQAAIAAGDDGALRAVIGIFENAGFVVRAAHELARELLPVAGVPTKRKPRRRCDGRGGSGGSRVGEVRRDGPWAGLCDLSRNVAG